MRAQAGLDELLSTATLALYRLGKRLAGKDDSLLTSPCGAEEVRQRDEY